MRLPILEGNTRRVFSRWIALRGSASDAAATKLLWQVAETMLPRNSPGAFNQAAMELGALVCSPKQPDCGQCPIGGMCRARVAGLQDEIPGKVSRVVYEDRTEFAMVIADPQRNKKTPRYLLRPLPEGRRWAGLWDFPRTTETSFGSVTAAECQLSEELGVKISAGMRIISVRHAVTKYRIRLHVHSARLDGSDRRPCQPWRYVSLAEMADLPMSVTGRKIAELLAEQRQTALPLR
jgi:A/G-specific adenine glycosylase